MSATLQGRSRLAPSASFGNSLVGKVYLYPNLDAEADDCWVCKHTAYPAYEDGSETYCSRCLAKADKGYEVVRVPAAIKENPEAPTDPSSEPLTIAEIEEQYPQPWLEIDTPSSRWLNDNGFMALSHLLAADCIDLEEMERATATNNLPLSFSCMAKGAANFIKFHHPSEPDMDKPSCITTLTNAELISLMNLYLFMCERRVRMLG